MFKDRYPVFFSGPKTLRFTLYVLGFIVLALLVQFPSTTRFNPLTHTSVILFSSLCTASALAAHSYAPGMLWSAAGLAGLYTLTAYAKLPLSMPLRGPEIVDAFALGAVAFSFASLFCVYAEAAQRSVLRLPFRCAAALARIAIVVPPAIFIGYFILSRRLLSAPILLALFQTNPGEAVSYLRTQEPIPCLAAFSFILAACVIALKVKPHYTKTTLSKLLWITTFFVVLFGWKALHEIRECHMTKLISQTREALQEYRAYTKGALARRNRLQELSGLHIAPSRGGLYVLVIGESETRDHMHAYGYAKKTTPWLDQATAMPQNVLFKNAYTNDIHTVSSLTYALTAKNQYNSVKLKDAPSINEVAKAAGYTVYWLSNQLQYGGWDIPVAIISSTADHQVWINENTGKTTYTQFYDGQLLKELMRLRIPPGQNTLVVIHLMGNHTIYPHRYPPEFEIFPVPSDALSKNVAEYDNSVFYVDHVLKGITETAAKNKDFQCLIYLSDHGEEPDLKYAHEASKFTWQMTRIPLFITYSDSFAAKAPEICEAFNCNKERFWTNDLLYELLIHVMGIKNAPHYREKYDLSSFSYSMNPDKLKTMHGRETIKDDPILHKSQ